VLSGKKKRLSDARLHLTVEYRAVGASTWLAFEAGNPVHIENNNKDSIRIGLQRDVAKNQYEVRLKLENTAFHVLYNVITCDDTGENCTQSTQLLTLGFTHGDLTKVLSWDFLKSFQPDDADYSGQKRVCLAIKASGQLNGRIDAFNAMVSSQVPVWNGSAFVNQVSSNPAWQFLAVARGGFTDSQRLWGAGLPDARIDIDTIKLWGAWCDAKGLSCNIIFDSKINVDAMLNTIARCGRSASSWASGKLGIVYDEANKPVTAVYGMANIIRNTFKVSYITGKLADEIIVAFTNAELNYQRDTVSALVPGVVNPINSVTIELRGITDKTQAGKEALLIAAEQFYRRRQITWESDIEGLAVQRGDVAIVSHDLTQWDYSGRLDAGTTNVLTLDREVPFTPGTQHYIGVRYPDGSYNIYDVVLASGEQNVINLITPLPTAPDSDAENLPMDYLWYFAPKATPGKQVKITDVQPLSQNRVRIIATDEDDNYYLSENNSYTYVPPGTFAASLPTISNLVVRETLIQVGTGFASRVTLSWDIDGEYGGAFIRFKDEAKAFKDAGKTLDRKFSFETETNRSIVVEVVAFNLQGNAGDASKATQTLLLVGTRLKPNDILLFSAATVDTGIQLSWSPVEDVDLAEYEIRQGFIAKTLINPDQWVVGSSGNQGDFRINGAASENSIVLDTGTQGEQQPVWLCSPDLNYDADGGWNVNINIDPAKFYRQSVFVKKTGSVDGTTYLGCGAGWDGANKTLNLNGTENINPYHWAGDLPQLDKWYLLVGYVHGADYTGGDTGKSGVYDPATGLQIIVGTDYKNDPTTTQQMQRAYLYYASLGTASQQFVQPRFEEDNASAPSLLSLMSTATAFADAVFIEKMRSTGYLYDSDLGSGDKNFMCVAIDTSGNQSANPASVAINILPPNNVTVALIYSGENILVNYSADKQSFPIAEYEVRIGDTWSSGTTIQKNDGTSTLYKVDFLNANFWVKAIDIYGNESTEAGASTTVAPPDALSFRQEVIDNNVLLRWNKQQGTLPVVEFEIRKGDVFASAEILQSIDGTFAAFFEILAGEYKYWLTAIDSAGNTGVNRPIVANVSQPPDFILNINWQSAFAGTKNNVLLTYEGALLLLVNTAETWTNHFVNNAWDQPQDQITAGYDYYIQPTKTTGSYSEDFDYGAVLASTSIKVILNRNDMDGAVTITPNIKIKKLSTDPWTDIGNVWTAFAVDFRYVQITLTVSATGNANLTELLALNVQLDSKIISEIGNGVANSGDSGGTTVNFTPGKFVDIESISVTANSTSAITAVYDFVDVANPTSFSVYLFNASGVRVSGDFSWTATGY
jgi:hypothetical protein